MKQRLIVAGFAVLSAVALAGWTRGTHVTPSYFNPAANGCEQQSGAAVNYGYPAAYYPPAPMGTPVMSVPAQPQTAYYRESYAPAYAPAPRRVARRQYVSERTVTQRRGRSFGHSAAIVAGSAGAGAAIGALAGGGRGAAIGALAGGGAGFVYDRLTRNR